MRSLPLGQILLLLLLILVPLFNLLVRWVKRLAHEQPRAPLENRTAEADARERRPPASIPPRARVVEMIAREGRPKAASAPLPPPVRRAGPLGGRAGVRRAVVAMTILGSCRGLEER